MSAVVCPELTGFLLGSCQRKGLGYNPAMFSVGRFTVVRLLEVEEGCCNRSRLRHAS